MTRLVRPAFAKINLGLEIVGKRPDGFHELRTVFQTISLSDRLVFEYPARRFSLRTRGGALPSLRENLVFRAARAFGRIAGALPRVRITLSKRIPVAAGLGGGSSDAAVTLLTLNRIAGRPLDRETLATIAARLGSDVPFFLTGGTALGLGRGEIVRPLRDLQPARVMLLVPDFGVSTREAFRMVETLTRKQGRTSIYRFSRQRVRARRSTLELPNDLAPIAGVQRRLHQGALRFLIGRIDREHPLPQPPLLQDAQVQLLQALARLLRPLRVAVIRQQLATVEVRRAPAGRRVARLQCRPRLDFKQGRAFDYSRASRMRS